jgi:hypothetical protein
MNMAVQQGLLQHAYAYHTLRVVPKTQNNRILMELDDAFTHWQGLPTITEQEAACFISSVGGQGMVKCNCKGDCTSNSCACNKAGRLCSSCCHRNSKCCKNNSELVDNVLVVSDISQFPCFFVPPLWAWRSPYAYG